jgi:hypothetical protein
LEVTIRCAFLNYEFFNNISGVSVDGNQTHNLLTKGSVQITLHHLDKGRETINLFI